MDNYDIAMIVLISFAGGVFGSLISNIFTSIMEEQERLYKENKLKEEE